MQVSVEISLYPLSDHFIPPIQEFIDRLNRHTEITVVTNTMSTQVFGQYSDVLRIVSAEMQTTHQHTPKAAFAMKVLAGDLSPND